MKHQPYATANATACTAILLYATCALLVAIAPELTINIFQSWFHGIDISQIATWNVTGGSLFMGFVTMTGYAWVMGYIFALLYNSFLKK